MCAVEGGVAVSHRFYFDLLDFQTQLGLTDAATEPVTSGASSRPGG